MEYSFDVEIASQHSVEEAIILKNLAFWIATNANNDKHFYDGYYWTYNGTKAFSGLFPFWSPEAIYRILKKLETKKIIKSGNYNKLKMDRTLWYTIIDDDVLHKLAAPILRNCKIDFAKLKKPFSENTKAIPDIKPDIKPDEKQEREESPPLVSKNVVETLKEPEEKTKPENINAVYDMYQYSKKAFEAFWNRYRIGEPKPPTLYNEFTYFQLAYKRAIRDDPSRKPKRLTADFEDYLRNFFDSKADWVKNSDMTFSFFLKHYERFVKPQNEYEKTPPKTSQPSTIRPGQAVYMGD